MEPTIPLTLVRALAALEASGNGCYVREATGDQLDQCFADLPATTQIRYCEQAETKLRRLSEPELRPDLRRWVAELP